MDKPFAMKRCTLAGADQINDSIAYVDFYFNEAGKVIDVHTFSTRFDHVNGDRLRYTAGSPWSWHNAQSLLESGHWRVISEWNKGESKDKPTGGDMMEGGPW